MENILDTFINKLIDDIHDINPELSLKRQTEYNKICDSIEPECKFCGESTNRFNKQIKLCHQCQKKVW